MGCVFAMLSVAGCGDAVANSWGTSGDGGGGGGPQVPCLNCANGEYCSCRNGNGIESYVNGFCPHEAAEKASQETACMNRGENWGCGDTPQCDDDDDDGSPNTLPTLPTTLSTTTEPEPTTSESSSSSSSTSGTTISVPTSGDVSYTTGAVDPTAGTAAYCEEWNPADHITYVGGTYYVQQEFVSDLVAYPYPLIDCEDFFIASLTSGGFSFERLAVGDMFYELGLRSDDIPVSLNGLPLNGRADVINAYVTLWAIEAETEFELEVLRGITPITFFYELIP